MERSVKERIIEYLKYISMGQTKFEKLVGLSNGYISKLKSSPSPEKLTKIFSKFPDLNRDWLLYGEGEMLNKDDDDEVVSDIDEYDGNIVPLLPVEAMAGGLREWAQGVELADCRKVVSPVPGADFAIQVSGDSMQPEISDGSYLYIKRINHRAFIPWGNTMVVDTENGVVVKKIFPSDTPDAITARSVNPAYPPFDIPTDSIIGIYRVLGGSFIASTI